MLTPQEQLVDALYTGNSFIMTTPPPPYHLSQFVYEIFHIWNHLRLSYLRAAGANHVNIMEYLIEKGALVRHTDKSGRTALHWASISGHRDAVEV